jgi:CubicO group peptidase (beta-lactamase class C family)
VSFDEAAAIVSRAIEAQVFPAATVEVGRAGGPLWEGAWGALAYDDGAAPTSLDTVFDLASLTKVVATTTLAMRHADGGRLALTDRLGEHLPRWQGDDRSAVTIADLLAHTGGLAAHEPLFHDHAGRAEFEPRICRLPLEYEPRTKSVYSDLGFILLGFLLEDLGKAGLDAQFGRTADACGLASLSYAPPPPHLSIAPAGDNAWRGRRLVGEVHDDNGWALGGVAGHTGLFGTAAAVGRFARLILKGLAGEPTLAQPDTVRQFTRRADVPGSSRALGWDTMLPTSSCGHRLSPSAIGHTGFTGTSLWIDPARDLYIVFLTNRVHPAVHDAEAIRAVRPALHDAVVDAAPQGVAD